MITGEDLNENEVARREVLIHSPVIAIVGRSNDHYYSSYDVGAYLEQEGYIVYSVNPNLEEIDGEHVYASLSEIPEKVNIVDVFRKSQFLPGIVDEAIAIGAETVWAQLMVVSDEARAKALKAGLNFAQDLCIRTEHERLFDNLVQG
ncbi:MAG: CoA-binding protein [Anaerolineae bacterium]|nr:CoA-binding protein [Anaerolineae bacterium]